MSQPSQQSQQMRALITVEPGKAKEKILAALKTSKVHMATAAAALGCTHGTLLRWIADLELTRAVEQMKGKAIKEGWHHGRKGGRPVGKTASARRKSAASTRIDAR